MKRFLIVLLGLLCTPLVAYGAWRLVFLYISTGMPLVFLAGAIVVAAVASFSFVSKEDITTLAYSSTRNDILRRYKEKLITEDQKNLLIEEVDEMRFAAMKAREQREIEQEDKHYIWTIGKKMSVFLIIIFLATIAAGIGNYSDYKHIGNVIVTNEAIYSKTGVMIADPEGEPDRWEKIEINGETYIRYFNNITGNISYETYDLNGNLVKVEEDR